MLIKSEYIAVAYRSGQPEGQEPHFIVFGIFNGEVYTLSQRHATRAEAEEKAKLRADVDIGMLWQAAHGHAVANLYVDFVNLATGAEVMLVHLQQHFIWQEIDKVETIEKPTLALQFPKYWKPLPKGWNEVDVYRVCQLFPVEDPSGRINHARKKLLVPGVRTGGKSMHTDIKEAIATLQSWLDDNPEVK